MPLYSFECENCGTKDDRVIPLDRFDELVPRQHCEICNGKMRKLISIPALRTTTTFMAGSDDGFGNDNRGRKIALAKARKAGVNVSGKKFHPGLARRGIQYDPNAWYGSESEVRAKAEAKGCNLTGSITHTTGVRDSDYAKAEAPYRVSAATVAPEVELEVKRRHGGKATKEQVRKLYEEKIDLHSGNG